MVAENKLNRRTLEDVKRSVHKKRMIRKPCNEISNYEVINNNFKLLEHEVYSNIK